MRGMTAPTGLRPEGVCMSKAPIATTDSAASRQVATLASVPGAACSESPTASRWARLLRAGGLRRPVGPQTAASRPVRTGRRVATATGLALAGLGLAAWFAPQQVRTPWSIEPVAAQQRTDEGSSIEQAGGLYGPGKAEFDFVRRPSRRYVSGGRDGGPIRQVGFGGGPTFDAEPTDEQLREGSAEDVGGFGVMGRAGHVVVTDNSPIASESLTFVEAMPYTIIDDTMIFGDGRLYRTNDAQTGYTAGAGVRHYFDNWNKVLGVSGFYDHDDSRDRLFQQLSLGLELFGENWDLQANGYMPIDDTVQVTGTRILAGSEQFVDNRLLFTRLTDVSAAAKGVDTILTVPLRWAGWMEAIALETNLGAYHYQAADVDNAEKVWGGRAGLDAGFFKDIVHASLDVTTDNQFDTNLIFAVEVAYHGGMNSLRHRGSQKHRLAKFVDRNWTVTTLDTTVAGDPEAAINPDTGDPYFILHVANNGLADGERLDYPSFDPAAAEGTFENPYEELAVALIDVDNRALDDATQNADVVYARAGSLFTGDSFATALDVPDGLRLLGEGFVTDAGAPREVVHTLPVANFSSGGGNGLVILPTPTIDLILDEATQAAARDEITLAREDITAQIAFPERPTLRGLEQGDFGVELGNGVEFSGWRIENNLTEMASLYAEGVTNGATGLDGTPAALVEDVSILALRGGRSLGDGVLLEDTSGDLLFNNLRIGTIADDNVIANVGGVEQTFSQFIEGTPEGVSFRVQGGNSDITVAGTGLELPLVAPSLIAQTGSIQDDGDVVRNYAVQIDGMAANSQVSLVGATIVDGFGLFDDDSDPLTAAATVDGGRGVLVGSLNTPVNVAGAFSNQSDVDFGVIQTGAFGGNTDLNGVAISNTTGTTRFFAPVDINRSGAAFDPADGLPPGTHAGLLISNLGGTGQVLGLDTIDRDGTITITNRFGAGIDLNNIQTGGLVNLAALTTIESFNPLDTTTPAPTSAVGINFQSNLGAATFGDIDMQFGTGPGINIGLENGTTPGVVDTALQNGSLSRFTAETVTFESIGSPDTTAAGGAGTANLQVIDDFASVAVSEIIIEDRGGIGIDVFEARGGINLGTTAIDDDGLPNPDTAVRIRQNGGGVRFSSLTITDNATQTLIGFDPIRNPFETPIVRPPFTVDLDGFVTDNPVVLVENNIFGGDGPDGAVVDLGEFNVESDGGIALFALNNRELRNDRGVLEIENAEAIYVANTFDLDLEFEQIDNEDAGLFSVRLLNNRSETGDEAFVIDPTDERETAAPGAGGDITNANTAIYITDLDGDVYLNGLDIENDTRGILIENTDPDEPLDFLLAQTAPSISLIDDPTADPTLDLFDVEDDDGRLTEAIIVGTAIEAEDAGTQEGIRLDNIQNVFMDQLVLEDNTGLNFDDEQIVIRIDDYDEEDGSFIFNYVLSNSILSSDGLGTASGERNGLLDVDVSQDTELTVLQFDIFDNIFELNNSFMSAIDIETDGALAVNPVTNRGISNNLITGGTGSDQTGIRIEQDNDEVDSTLAFLDNIIDLGTGDEQVGYDLDFDGPLNLRIGIDTGTSVITVNGTDNVGVLLELGSAGNDVLIDNTAFTMNGARARGIVVDSVTTPSSFNITGNSFTFGQLTRTTFGFGGGFTTIFPPVTAIEFNRVRQLDDGGTISLFSDNPIGGLPDGNITNFAGATNSSFFLTTSLELFDGVTTFDGLGVPFF